MDDEDQVDALPTLALAAYRLLMLNPTSHVDEMSTPGKHARRFTRCEASLGWASFDSEISIDMSSCSPTSYIGQGAAHLERPGFGTFATRVSPSRRISLYPR